VGVFFFLSFPFLSFLFLFISLFFSSSCESTWCEVSVSFLEDWSFFWIGNLAV
jgi:hypothetical protein